MLTDKINYRDCPQHLNPSANNENFDEAAYLLANPDVADAVNAGRIDSGYSHYILYGELERRHLRFPVQVERKKLKLKTIQPLLRNDIHMQRFDNYFDFLTSDLREQFNIIDTNAVSSNDYDHDVLELIRKHRDGIILDCGAGSRGVYYQHVVNLEIAVYPSTDVRGVGEVLPFKDDSFDAIISIAVLEHVKDPWLCAQEIIRVLKPGGDLFCCVPFLQPLHGYPHHYYNMTGQGLVNLFESGIQILRHEVPVSMLPIWSLTWILGSWANGLDNASRDEFMSLRVSDLISDPVTYLSRNFVKGLSHEKNMELASGTMIMGNKRLHVDPD